MRVREISRRTALALMGAAGAAVALDVPDATATPVDDGNGTVTAGRVRLTVITSGLIRYEYSPTGRFEDRPTMLAHNRSARSRDYRTIRSAGSISVGTDLFTLSSPTGHADPVLTLKHSGAKVRPEWRSGEYVPALTGTAFAANAEVWTSSIPQTPPGTLGGWLRCLDSVRGATPLQPGILSRSGWAFIDDTYSVLVPAGGGHFQRRRARNGYRDGYFFVYGDDYPRALADLRTLSGDTPLLPRQAFGVWYSRYAAYDDHYFRTGLIPQFRRSGAVLDVLIVDTDFKSPNSWNGWNWNRRLFPEPRTFVAWAHKQKLAVGLNIHPTIAGDDARYPTTARIAGGLLAALAPAARFFSALKGRVSGALGPSFAWDFARRRHVESYMALHDSFERDGIDFWWLDWILDESLVGIGRHEIADDVWLAHTYLSRPRAQRNRWLLLARNGASYWDMVGTRPGPWGGHRYSVHFTGDTYSTWATLAFEVYFTHSEASIGQSYISHDIGGFKGETDPERYVRWMQFGAFAPIMRVHSQSLETRRLPWEFAEPYRTMATDALRIRSRLVPYLYTAARLTHESGMPMCRAMYLRWPRESAAYTFGHQYLLGDDLLVAPVVQPASAGRHKRIWFPPGRWVGLFGGGEVVGPRVAEIPVGLDDIPVYARAGSTVPLMGKPGPAVETTAAMSLRVFTGANGSSRLYHDDGLSTGYRDSGYSWTRIDWDDTARTLSVTTSSAGPVDGVMLPRITTVELAGLDASPRGVRVNGTPIPDDRWRFDRGTRMATASLGRIGVNMGSVARERV